MIPDPQLLARYHPNGDAAAFRDLVQAHAGMVFATAKRITRDEALAEDVAQETFFQLARQSQHITQSVAAWRRECLKCSFRFTTYEIVEREELRVMKRNGATEPFDRNKLLGGMKKACEKACEKRPVKIEDLEQAADEIADELEEEGHREVPFKVIGAKVMQRLEAIDHVTYVRYASVYRQFADVGEFISEITSLSERAAQDDPHPKLF